MEPWLAWWPAPLVSPEDLSKLIDCFDELHRRLAVHGLAALGAKLHDLVHQAVQLWVFLHMLCLHIVAQITRISALAFSACSSLFIT